MSYMNTERDNFYDWAKDKPDTTSSSPLVRSHSVGRRPQAAASPWIRLALLGVIVVALSAACRFFLN